MIDKITFVLTFVVFALLIFTYVKRQTMTLNINGVEYIEAGMLEQDINGTNVYVPFYRRNDK